MYNADCMAYGDWTLDERQTFYAREITEHLCDILGPPPAKRLYSSPTGSGKGVIEVAVLDAVRTRGVHCGLLCPTPDIALSVAAKHADAPADLLDLSDAKQRKALRELHIWPSVVAYLNAVADGSIEPYDALILDEGHHGIAETYTQALGMSARVVLLTATPYRGTARATRDLYAEFGEPRTIYTEAETIALGRTSMPTFVPAGLLDDDKLAIDKGEFADKAVERATLKQIERYVDYVDRTRREGRFGVLVLPTVKTVEAFCQMWNAEGDRLEALQITAKTTRRARTEAYEQARRGEALLVTVGVLTEGWDERVEDLWVARPWISPVAWRQCVGRAMRPGVDGVVHELTRNLERHSYLFAGIMPSSTVREAQTVFGEPSKRSMAATGKRLDLEALERFKPFEFPLADGTYGVAYTLFDTSTWRPDPSTGARMHREMVLLAIPHTTEIWAYERWHWRDKWRRVRDVPEDLTGYNTSQKRYPLSDPMREWYGNQALSIGLDPTWADTERMTGRVFQVFAALAKNRVRLPIDRDAARRLHAVDEIEDTAQAPEPVDFKALMSAFKK